MTRGGWLGSTLLSPFFFFFFFATSLLSAPATAQRLKDGCFDAKKLSCSPPAIPIDYPTAFSAEDICTRLANETFPAGTQVFYFDDLHADHLNAIDSDSEYCQLIELYYHECSFCMDSMDYNLCLDVTRAPPCGGMPSREEVLLDTSGNYSQFESEEDIGAVCEALDIHFYYDDLVESNVPTTVGLCKAAQLVNHLCPGNCDGDCFDPAVYPPGITCDPQYFTNTSLDVIELCTDILYYAFGELGREIVLDVSQHASYLSYWYDGDPWCDQLRQVYSQCAWCAETQCFTESNPPTCDPPESEGLRLRGTNTYYHQSVINVEDMCYYMYHYNTLDTDYIWEGLIAPGDTTFCDQARQVFHLCYWCVSTDGFCPAGIDCNSTFALPDGFQSPTLTALELPTPALVEEENLLSDYPYETDHGLDCDLIYIYWNETKLDPFSSINCFDNIFLALLCPDDFCPIVEAEAAADAEYLGASTTPQKRALIWVSRTSALLSFGGASYILWDILHQPKLRGTVYHQLLLGMAIFDSITAIAWGFSTLPIDTQQMDHVEGAKGSAATCTAQAFFIQLGFTSIFYNVSLALYYVLVVVHSWREFQLMKIRLYMHAVPIVLGFGLALGGIPIYSAMEYSCHVLPPPDGELWQVLVFVIGPVDIAIVAITSLMFVVYGAVRKQAKKARKWNLGSGVSNTIEDAVFWQCLSYMMAFYISWPILNAVYLASVDVNGPLGLTLLVAFLAPLQGFNNWCVYMRPKIKKQKFQSLDTQISKSFASMMRNMNAGLASMASSVSSRSSRRSRSSGNVSLGFGVSSMFGNMIRGMSTPNFDEEDSSSEKVVEEEEPEIYMDPSCLLALRGSTAVSQSIDHSAPGGKLDMMALFKEDAKMKDGSRMRDRSRQSVMDWFKANAETKDDSKAASRQDRSKQSSRLRGNALEDAVAGVLEEEEEIDFSEGTKKATFKGFAEMDEGAMMDFLSGEDLAPIMVEPQEAFSDASTETGIDSKRVHKDDVTAMYLDDLITSGEAVIQEGHDILQSTRGLQDNKFSYDTDATDTEILQSGSSESKPLEDGHTTGLDGQQEPTDADRKTTQEVVHEGQAKLEEHGDFSDQEAQQLSSDSERFHDNNAAATQALPQPPTSADLPL